MPTIFRISGQEIDQTLRDATRQYLVGDLQKPQALQHVPSSLIEIGITRYENEGKSEAPHRHTQAFEFQYMTAGLTAYLDLTTGQEHVFRKGDFYAIDPMLFSPAKVIVTAIETGASFHAGELNLGLLDASFA